MSLALKNCTPCEGGVTPLTREDSMSFLATVHEDWNLSEDGRFIQRDFGFVGFNRPMMFANAVAFIAAEEGHHPEIVLSYGRCIIRYWTHAIDGLSENDFICAAKIDRLLDDR